MDTLDHSITFVRLANEDDIPALVEMTVTLAQVDAAFGGPGRLSIWHHSILEESVREMVTQPRQDRVIFVAEGKSEVVGFAVGRDMENPDHVTPVHTSELAEIYVRPEYRGKGVADTLLLTIEQWAWDRGHREITLYVHTRNEVAKAFYTRSGYRADYELWRKPLTVPNSPGHH